MEPFEKFVAGAIALAAAAIVGLIGVAQFARPAVDPQPLPPIHVQLSSSCPCDVPCVEYRATTAPEPPSIASCPHCKRVVDWQYGVVLDLAPPPEPPDAITIEVPECLQEDTPPASCPAEKVPDQCPPKKPPSCIDRGCCRGFRR